MYRGALTLLAGYGGDSSDEEVPIGRVSTKRCHKDSEDEHVSKRLQTRLPLPHILTETMVNNQDIPTDDPSMHSGRIRSFPYERGNWATYVFIPYEPPDDAMAVIITSIVNSLPHIELQPINHFHVSLTKTVVLKHHWIDSFVQSVREQTAHTKKFIAVFDSLKVYCNEERTRTFVGLQIKSGYDTLLKLTQQLDSCLDEFRLPQFYENPSFHMSLAWCTGDHVTEISNVLPQLNSVVEKVLLNYPQSSWYNYVTHLECKCGNKLYTFNLSN